MEKIESVEQSTVCRKLKGWDAQLTCVAIRTSEQTINILLDEDQQCCETFDWEQPDDLVGRTLLAVLDDESWEEVDDDTNRHDVNIILRTDAGDRVFGFSNAHNGYYGHCVMVESAQLTKQYSL